jgi:hypothetical protein
MLLQLITTLTFQNGWPFHKLSVCNYSRQPLGWACLLANPLFVTGRNDFSPTIMLRIALYYYQAVERSRVV